MTGYTRNAKGEVLGSVSTMVVEGPNGERTIVNAVTNYDDHGKPTV